METKTSHWAEPSAPSQAQEARYRRAVVSGLTSAAFEAVEDAMEEEAGRALDERLTAAKARGASDVERWGAIYRAAVCAAAQAIAGRDWAAKRQALAIAEQADKGRQVVFAAIFGAPKAIPAQYAGMERSGAAISRAESSAALKVIAADRAAARQQNQSRQGRW